MVTLIIEYFCKDDFLQNNPKYDNLKELHTLTFYKNIYGTRESWRIYSKKYRGGVARL